MSNNIGPILGAGLSLVALGVAVKATKGIMDTMQTQAKPTKRNKANDELYHKIWG